LKKPVIQQAESRATTSNPMAMIRNVLLDIGTTSLQAAGRPLSVI